MSTETSVCTTPVALATEGRDQANVLLQTLMNDRRLVEARHAATGRDDPLKKLTGRSSMDRAIVSTREIMRRMNDLLAELRGMDETAPTANGTASRSTSPARKTRTASRPMPAETAKAGS